MTMTLTPATIGPQPAAEYHADYTAWSRGMIWDFAERRRKAAAWYVHRTATKPDPKESSKVAMDKGTAAHSALLEPDQFASLVVVWPSGYLSADGGIRSNEAKAYRDAQRNLGRVILKDDQLATVRAMADSVQRVCGDWLKLPARKEHSIYWTDEATGLRLRCRPDWLIEKDDVVYIFDLKTTADASPAAFRRRCEEGGYWLQDVHYSAGVAKATGKEVQFRFVAVESEFPYACAIHRLDPHSVMQAQGFRSRTLMDLASCLVSDDWADVWEKVVNPISMRPHCFEL